MSMKIIENPVEMTEFSQAMVRAGKSIGFVPTMGALHEGHLSLVRAAKRETDCTAVSIFVNPTQFGPNEDFSKYPRTFEEDCRLLESVQTDVLFFPSAEALYPKNYQTFVDLKYLPDHLCGLKRPGHFQGVATVVSKLFNIVRPTDSYFGQKDYQQAAIIRRLNEDLNFNINIHVEPIVREADGLAMSSRNRYLSPSDRNDAAVLNQALKAGVELIGSGEKKAAVVIELMKSRILQVTAAVKIDYINIVDPDTLEDLVEIEGRAVLALAVFFGTTRLIDNMTAG